MATKKKAAKKKAAPKKKAAKKKKQFARFLKVIEVPQEPDFFYCVSS